MSDLRRRAAASSSKMSVGALSTSSSMYQQSGHTLMSDITLLAQIQEEMDIEKYETPDESSYFEESSTGLKAIYLLPYENVWRITLFVLAIYNTVTAFFQYTLPETPLFTDAHLFGNIISDVLFCVDGILGLLAKSVPNVKIDPAIIIIPNWLLICEILSAFPDEYFTENLENGAVKTMFKILDFDVLKILRPIYIFVYWRSQVGLKSQLIIVSRFMLLLSLIIPLCFTGTCLSFCGGANCSPNVTLERLSFSVSISTMRGFSGKVFNLTYIRFGISITILISFICVVWTVCELSNVYIKDLSNFFLSTFRKECVSRTCSQYKIRDKYRDKYLQYFNVHWKIRKGYDSSKPFYKYLPFSTIQELAVDISWPALKHAKLFQNMDLPFLRKIALVMRQDSMVAGEYLYRKDMVKHRMVYIVSGIVEVLSQADGETPILAFSSGTVLGETSLFINYKSITSVRCKNFCEFHMLHKKDFFKIAKFFPKQFQKLKKNVLIRYERAQKLRNLFLEVNQYEANENVDQLTITWLKNTLHRLMMQDGESSTEHECQNIYLREDFRQDKFDKMLFTGVYLDMLAITGRLELVNETVFIKASFPCVLLPNSVLLKVWNFILCTCVICTGFIIPYVAMVEYQRMEWFTTFHFFILVIYLLDIVIQVSTAVRTTTAFLVDVRTIFVYRMGTMEFWIDVIAAYPFEMYSCLTLTKLSSQNSACLLLNRVLKMWKIKTMLLDEMGDVNSWSKIIMRVHFKHLCILFYVIYLSGCLLYSRNCFEGTCAISVEGHTTVWRFVWFFYAAATIFTNTGMDCPYTFIQDHFYCYAVLMIMSLVFTVVILSETISVYYLKYFSRIKLEETINDILNVLKVGGVYHIYHDRIMDYVYAQWKYNSGSKIVFGTQIMSTMPGTLYRRFREEMFLDIVSNMEIFVGLRCDILSELCRSASPIFLPPGEVVTYSGSVTESFYCIINGFCDVYLGSSASKEKVITSKDCISVLEACLKIPTVNTVITVTHCELIVFNFKQVMSIFTKYPAELDLLKEVVVYCGLEKDVERLKAKENLLGTTETKRKPVGKDGEFSFYNFGYNLTVDSKEEYAYFVPFDKIHPFSWVNFFLMRVTIMPFGKFLFRWEIARCIFAFVSAILFIASPIYYSKSPVWKFSLIALDLTSLADIYLRFHVCYYNELGILVTHPLYTAKHYFTHAFFLDLICVFPTSILLKTDQQQTENKFDLFLQLFHVLQMYRYLGFFNILTDHVAIKGFIYVLKYIPLITIACNIGGLIITNIDCNFNDILEGTDDYMAGVRCSPKSIFTKNDFQKPMSPIYVHLVGVYFSSSVLTLSGMQGLQLWQLDDCIYTLSLGFLAAFLYYYLAGNLVAVHSVIPTTLLHYQVSLRAVKKFLISRKVKPYLRKELINHYELTWQRKKGKDLTGMIDIFNKALTQDILWDVFGVVLDRYSVFPEGGEHFFRQLLLETTHEMMQGGCYLLKVNCVNSHLYIVYKGLIDIIAPDGMKLTTIGRGSICGNLDNYSRCRQTVGLLCNGHVELLTIKATEFHTVLKKFPTLNRRFKTLTAMHIDYLPGRDVIVEEQVTAAVKYGKNRVANFFLHLRYFVYNPSSVGMSIWKAVIMIYVCYLQFCLIFYRIAITEISMWIFIQAILCDVLFVIDFYVFFHTAYEDDSGNLIKDLHLIRKRVWKQKLAMACYIISLIPIDIAMWFIPASLDVNRPKLHLVTRANKLFRIYFVFSYFAAHRQRLDVNLVAIRIVYFISIALIIIHGWCCFSIIINCLQKPNRIPPVLCFELADSNADSFDKFYSQYLENFFVLFTCILHVPQSVIYPFSGGMMVYFSLAMHICTLLIALIFAHMHTTTLMQSLDKLDYNHALGRLSFYMERQDVSLALLTRIWTYVRLLWRRHKGTPFPTLITIAPPILKSEIMNTTFGRHVLRCAVFEKCHEDFLRQIVAHMRPATYFPGDYVVFKGDIDDSMYFIHEGEVIILSEDTLFKESILGVLRQGQSFGILQGLQPLTAHVYSFRSKETTDVLVLEKSTWAYLLEFFPASKKAIYDGIELYGGY